MSWVLKFASLNLQLGIGTVQASQRAPLMAVRLHVKDQHGKGKDAMTCYVGVFSYCLYSYSISKACGDSF